MIRRWRERRAARRRKFERMRFIYGGDYMPTRVLDTSPLDIESELAEIDEFMRKMREHAPPMPTGPWHPHS